MGSSYRDPHGCSLEVGRRRTVTPAVPKRAGSAVTRGGPARRHEGLRVPLLPDRSGPDDEVYPRRKVPTLRSGATPVRVRSERDQGHGRWEDEMTDIQVFISVSLDGVMQAPARPDEDTRGGFSRGGWATPYADPVMWEGMGGPGSLLLGRRTYEDFSSVWPKRTDNPFT